ncbi:hypothetical protein [Rhizobium sp. AAP43]|uniref:hypothetical protein n=1 Tax=Rhizobium sp. AAP43 TaxID=1523420 RepID=UPI0006B97138|nr:hypothetical protein [Rhizobium sp. AAP43]KPF47264.1 hypothetical protein IP76_00385 [Rhizobium sp. AAP43]
MVKASLSTKLASLFSAQAKAAAEIRRDLNQIEAEIISKKNRLSDVLAAPIPLSEVEVRVDSFLNAREVEARTWFYPSLIADPKGSVHGSDISKALAKSDSGIGALAILGFREIIRSHLVAEAVAAMKGEPLSEMERERETKTLEAEIADLERDRERFTREAEKHGIAIPRSEDADPAALLAPDHEL